MTQLMTEQGIVRVPAGTWQVDPAHSSAAFEVRHMMIATVRGQFREFEGNLEAADDDPSHSRAWGKAYVASIDTGNPDRDAHLRGPDFFDAERYPEITYESTRVEHIEGGTYKITGELTIRGVTREVETKAQIEGAGEDPWGNERVGVSVRGTINRTDFGLRWNQQLGGGKVLVGEEVQILLDISAVRAHQ
jgi:polyisoprenoid-binding protein YceI